MCFPNFPFRSRSRSCRRSTSGCGTARPSCPSSPRAAPGASTSPPPGTAAAGVAQTGPARPRSSSSSSPPLRPPPPRQRWTGPSARSGRTARRTSGGEILIAHFVCLFIRSQRQGNIAHLYTNGRYNEKTSAAFRGLDLVHVLTHLCNFRTPGWAMIVMHISCLVDLDAVPSVLAPPEVFGRQQLIFEEAPPYD